MPTQSASWLDLSSRSLQLTRPLDPDHSDNLWFAKLSGGSSTLTTRGVAGLAEGGWAVSASVVLWREAPQTGCSKRGPTAVIGTTATEILALHSRATSGGRVELGRSGQAC